MRRKIIVCGLVIGFLLVLISSTVKSFAQSIPVDWGDAENISQTGGADNPLMIQDSSGDFHLLWQDIVADQYVYSKSLGDGWSPPISATVPFTEVTPLLLTGNNNLVHAFWLDSDDDFLLYSSAFITNMMNLQGWSPIQELASTAVNLDVVLDSSDVLHLVYLDPEQSAANAAGVYYRRSLDGGQVWLPAEALYTSPYLRGLVPEDSNINLTSTTQGGRTKLIAAWDNRSRKRIYLAESNNSGVDWEEPFEVAGPESGSSVVLPFNIKVAIKDEQVVIIWSNGGPEVNCRQISQVSNDLGETWQAATPMANLFVGGQGCVRENKFLLGSELLYLLSSAEGQSYLWAWDGMQWSEPELQEPLTYFENPQTFNAVVLRCQQPMVKDDNLVVAGCEGDVGGFNDGDIWVLSRPLGGADVWFPSVTNWTVPALVESGTKPAHSPLLVANPAGELLAFWVEPEGDGNLRPKIYNARMEDGVWLLPEEILTAPGPMDSELAATIGPAGNIYFSWGDSLGEIYFVSTLVSNAHLASTWPAPAIIPGIEQLASYPELTISSNNVLYVVYAVMVNDGRGIYLVSSNNRGQTWTEPKQIFDAAAAGWELVGPAHLAVTADDQIQLFWEDQTLLRDLGPRTKALYYANSLDGGETFSEAALVVEGDITWSELVATDSKTAHKLWQVWDGLEYTLYHTYSTDGGQSWSEPSIVDIDMVSGPLTVTGNQSGDLYLFELTDTAVSEWLWTDRQWRSQAGFSLEPKAVYNKGVPAISAYATQFGHLGTLFSGVQESRDEEGNPALIYDLQAASRVIDANAVISDSISAEINVTTVSATPQGTEASTETIEETSVAGEDNTAASTEEVVAATPAPTATPVITIASNNEDATSEDNLLLNIALALIPIVIFVVIVIGISLYKSYLRR